MYHFHHHHTKSTQKVKGGRLDVEESSCKSVAYQIPIWHSGHVLRKFHAGVALSFPKRNNHSPSCFVIPLLLLILFFSLQQIIKELLEKSPIDTTTSTYVVFIQDC